VINLIAGTVTVLATDRSMLWSNSTWTACRPVQRQVLIEATIAEVRLSQTYQAGIDWRQLANNGNGFRIDQQLINPAGALVAPPSLIIGYGGPLADFNISVRMLEQFGNTRVLSSPKLMALNNQTALLKVVDNVVYFTITQQNSQAQTSNIITITSQPNTVSVGVVVSLTPQVHENGNVTLTVRPTISRVLRFVEDPNPVLTAAPNLVPELAVREMESVLQLTSGQTAILGGLMQDEVQRDRDQIPYAGSLPRVGDLFAYRNETVTKSELVIFIRPIVVGNPSLDSDASPAEAAPGGRQDGRESMSLLLQALQKASRSREAGPDEATAATPPPGPVQEPSFDFDPDANGEDDPGSGELTLADDADLFETESEVEPPLAPILPAATRPDRPRLSRPFGTRCFRLAATILRRRGRNAGWLTGFATARCTPSPSSPASSRVRFVRLPADVPSRHPARRLQQTRESHGAAARTDFNAPPRCRAAAVSTAPGTLGQARYRRRRLPATSRSQVCRRRCGARCRPCHGPVRGNRAANHRGPSQRRAPRQPAGRSSATGRLWKTRSRCVRRKRRRPAS
jgi:MSHA type pilus biogenesis protein MshL